MMREQILYLSYETELGKDFLLGMEKKSLKINQMKIGTVKRVKVDEETRQVGLVIEWTSEIEVVMKL